MCEMKGVQDGDHSCCALACEGDACETIRNDLNMDFGWTVLLQEEISCEDQVSASGEVQSAKTPLHWPNKDISPILTAHWTQRQPAGFVSRTLIRSTAMCSKAPMLVLDVERGLR